MSDEILVKEYELLKSSHKVAKKYNTSRHAVSRRLKELGKLLSFKESHKIRERRNLGKYLRTHQHKKNLSELASKRTGSKNHFYGKKHKDKTRAKLSEHAKKRTEKRNPNYKNKNYQRRPRDFKIHEFTPVKNFVFNRDKYTCFYCSVVGGHLHAHHKIPYWVSNEAFLDKDNLITVCTKCHFEKAHQGNWHHFDVSLIDDSLKEKYNLYGERLNELTSIRKKR